MSPLARLVWDSAFFGFPIAQVTRPPADAGALAVLERACRAEGIRCAYLRLPADDAHAAELASGAGFVQRDVRLTFERDVCAPVAAPSGSMPAVGRAKPEQRGALEALARDAFAHTRFLVDPGFPRERARELYAAFVRRGLDDAPRRLTLADADGSGVVVCHLDERGGVGTIELIAVAADSRRRGLGRALVAGALAAFAGAGLRRARVATQAVNVPSQRLYQDAGFRTREAELWLHRWFG